MGKFKLYKDSTSSFECDVVIEGASYSKSQARLVLTFKDRTLMFESDLIDNKVSIKIPALHDIDDSFGRATLEIIADSTYFKAWWSDFELLRKKNVAVKEIQVDETDQARITISEVEAVEYEVREEEELKLKESVSPKNYRFVKTMIEKFNELEESAQHEIMDSIDSVELREEITDWADTVFENTTTREAKFCMYEIQRNFEPADEKEEETEE